MLYLLLILLFFDGVYGCEVDEECKIESEGILAMCSSDGKYIEELSIIRKGVCVDGRCKLVTSKEVIKRIGCPDGMLCQDGMCGCKEGYEACLKVGRCVQVRARYDGMPCDCNFECYSGLCYEGKCFKPARLQLSATKSLVNVGEEVDVNLHLSNQLETFLKYQMDLLIGPGASIGSKAIATSCAGNLCKRVGTLAGRSSQDLSLEIIPAEVGKIFVRGSGLVQVKDEVIGLPEKVLTIQSSMPQGVVCDGCIPFLEFCKDGDCKVRKEIFAVLAFVFFCVCVLMHHKKGVKKHKKGFGHLPLIEVLKSSDRQKGIGYKHLLDLVGMDEARLINELEELKIHDQVIQEGDRYYYIGKEIGSLEIPPEEEKRGHHLMWLATLFMIVCFGFILYPETGFERVGEFKKGEYLIQEDGKPLILYFTKAGCVPCDKGLSVFKSSMERFGEWYGSQLSSPYVVARVVYLDNMRVDEKKIFDKFSPGKVPTLVLGGRYYSVGWEMGDEVVIVGLVCSLIEKMEVCDDLAVKHVMDRYG
jgi:hypothetical protein